MRKILTARLVEGTFVAPGIAWCRLVEKITHSRIRERKSVLEARDCYSIEVSNRNRKRKRHDHDASIAIHPRSPQRVHGELPMSKQAPIVSWRLLWQEKSFSSRFHP